MFGWQFADVFVPDFGMFGDVAGEQIDTLDAVEIDDANAVFAKPVDAALEVAAFADNECSDAELADKAAAIPARSKGGDHDQVAIGSLPACVAEGVGFAMHGRIILLNAAVVSAAYEGSILLEKRCADGDSTFGEALTRFFDGDGEHRVVKRRF